MKGTPTNWSPRRLPVLLLNAALVLPPALLYSVKTDTPVYVLITAAILLFAFFRKTYLPLGDRSGIYSMTAALILTIFPDMLIVIDDSRYGIFDLLVRSNLVIPLMTYLAAFSCAFYPYPARRGITAAGVISAMVLCGDRFNYMRLNNQLMPFLDPLLQHYALFYGIAAGWVILAVLLNFHYPGGIEGKEGKSYSRFFRRTLLAFFLILVPLSAAALGKYYYSSDTLMRAVEYYIIRISFRRLAGRGPNRSQTMLSPRTDLNRPLPRDSTENTVLFRAKAPRAPGYLRSGVYDFYRSGRWRPRRDPPETVKLNAERRTGLVSYSTFSLPEKKPAKDGLEIELYFAALRSGGRIPAPGGVLELDAVADSGEATENGLFTLKQWKPDGGCTLRTAQDGLNAAWPGPADPEKEIAYLAVPKELREPLKKTVTAFKGKTGSDLQTIQKLREYFSDHSYTLENVNSGHDRDPLLWFLERSRAGHCEFFASAAVLLLRSAGIPARYVTGFICEEKNPVSGHYVVRGLHAHAWCEAYLRERRQWIPVDLTPDDVLSSFRRGPENTRFRTWLDALKQLFSELFADIRRGHFAQAVMNIIIGIALLVWKLAGTIPGAAAVLTVIILLALRWYRGRKRAEKSGRGEMPLSRRRLAGEFARFERRYAKATGRKRPESMALREFYQEPPALELCGFYERLRYGKPEPSEDEIHDFTLRAARTVEGLMRKSASRPPQD